MDLKRMNVRKNKRIKISQLQNRQTQKQALFLIIDDTLERKEHGATKINHDMKSAVGLRRNEKKKSPIISFSRYYACSS